jgi:hypothetical protein
MLYHVQYRYASSSLSSWIYRIILTIYMLSYSGSAKAKRVYWRVTQ